MIRNQKPENGYLYKFVCNLCRQFTKDIKSVILYNSIIAANNSIQVSVNINPFSHCVADILHFISSKCS